MIPTLVFVCAMHAGRKGGVPKEGGGIEEEKVCVMWEIACSVRSPKKEEEELGEEILPSPVSQLGKNGDSYSLVRMIRGKIRNKVVNQFSPENARKKSQ